MKRFKMLAAVLAAAAILLKPAAAVAGAQSAMQQWACSVAPALFPFLALMPVLTGPEACAAYEALFSGIMRPVFRLPGAAAPAVIIGMISGSPGGAVAITRIAAQTRMKPSQSRRIALAVCSLSPSYLILGVGQGLYNSPRLGMQLAGVQIAIQLILLLILRPFDTNGGGAIPSLPESEIRSPIRTAVEIVLTVCGYMVFFSSIAAVIAQFIGEDAGRLLLLIMDLPSGLPQLVRWNISGRALLQGLAIGFGGLCIAAQNLDVLRSIGVRTGEYLAVRCLAGLMFATAVQLLPIKEWNSAAELTGVKNTYAFSLLFAMLAAVPALIYFSNTFFLNKRKPGKSIR